MSHPRATCHECARTFPVSIEEAIPSLDPLRPALTVECPFCGAQITTPLSDDKPVASAAWVEKHRAEEGRYVDRVTVGDPGSRLRSGHITEAVLHQYFASNYQHYGFASIQGPFTKGPDFLARRTQRSRWIAVEIERDTSDFLAHGHHRDPAFANLGLLVVGRDSTREDRRALLPDVRIEIIDPHEFAHWLGRAGAPGALGQTFREARHAGWVACCPDAGREMAVCPDCTSCAYFEAFPWDASDPISARLTVKIETALLDAMGVNGKDDSS